MLHPSALYIKTSLEEMDDFYPLCVSTDAFWSVTARVTRRIFLAHDLHFHICEAYLFQKTIKVEAEYLVDPMLLSGTLEHLPLFGICTEICFLKTEIAKVHYD